MHPMLWSSSLAYMSDFIEAAWELNFLYYWPPLYMRGVRSHTSRELTLVHMHMGNDTYTLLFVKPFLWTCSTNMNPNESVKLWHWTIEYGVVIKSYMWNLLFRFCVPAHTSPTYWNLSWDIMLDDIGISVLVLE